MTGVSYLLEADKQKILIDCGLFQGGQELEARNEDRFAFNPEEIDAVLITHSHLDHIGRLPLLVKEGFRGKIFATPPTIDFTRLMLEDTKKILAQKAKQAGKIPFFDGQEIQAIMSLFVPVEYHKKTKISDGIYFEFYEAGHILGSAIIKLSVGEGRGKKTIVFSGDLGNYPVPILRPPETVEEADYVLIESTYGDRIHEERGKAKELIEDVVEEAITKKAVLLIPSFAVERTQQLLYHLNEIVENRRIPIVPIFIDSPLAIGVTKIYKKYVSYFNQEAENLIKSGDDIFKFAGLKFTPSSRESKKINDVPPPKIIIAGSGMSQGGRILHHELRYLPDEKNILLMVTYQAEGTLGKEILEGAPEIEILDQRIPVRAKIKSISSYSAHADQKSLFKWLCAIRKPIKKIFVVQGEKKPSEALAQIIRDDLGIDAKVPKMGEVVELE